MKLIYLILVAGFVVSGCSVADPLPLNTPISTSVPLPTDTSEPTKLPFRNALAFELPGMEQVQVNSMQYSSFEGQPLLMDLYYPVERANAPGYPVVIFVFGIKTSALDLRNHEAYQSWGRLIAADGMVAVVYETEDPQDLSVLITHLKENAEELAIDTEHIGLWSCSSNAPAALSYAMQEDEKDVDFLVVYYGFMLSPDNYLREEHDTFCASMGCYGAELNDVERIRSDLPLFIVRASLDDTGVNATIDHFIEIVSKGDFQVTLIDHGGGIHGFDFEQQDERSAEIIKMTLEFMKSVFKIN